MQRALIREKVESAKTQRLKLEGTLLVASELEVPLGATFAVIQTKLSQFPVRVARYLVGLREAGEIEDRLRDEIDADLADIQAGRFTAQDAIAALIARMPWSEEAEALSKLVTFDGQDRAALVRLVTLLCTEALRQLGQRAIAATRDDAATAADPPALPPAAEGPSLPASAGSPPATHPDPTPGSDTDTVPDAPRAEESRTPHKPAPEKKQRRSRKPEPRKLPGAVEGAIYAEPKKKRRR